MVFAPTIPAGAVPSFVTSGVELVWGVRVEFVVGRGSSAPVGSAALERQEEERDGERILEAGDEGDGLNPGFEGAAGLEARPASAAVRLFEDLMQDERGTVAVAVERVECDSFEVVIPITVYGDIVLETGGEGDGDVKGIPI
jgi:RAB6A-GEF complex partner protein 2